MKIPEKVTKIAFALLVVEIAAAIILIVVWQQKLAPSNTAQPVLDTDGIAMTSLTPLAYSRVDKACGKEQSNVGKTECAINLLDRVAAEREWKQRKLETMKHPQINTYDMLPDLKTEQETIQTWRIGFEKARDNWCDAATTFVRGSGMALEIAKCQMEIELRAIQYLQDIYHNSILDLIYDSTGIVDFEPTSTDIDVFMKTNITKRGCVWAGEKDCSQ